MKGFILLMVGGIRESREGVFRKKRNIEY